MKNSKLTRIFFENFLEDIIQAKATRFAVKVMKQYRRIIRANITGNKIEGDEKWDIFGQKIILLDVKIEKGAIGILLQNNWYRKEGGTQWDIHFHVCYIPSKEKSELDIYAVRHRLNADFDKQCFWYSKISSIDYDGKIFTVVFENQVLKSDAKHWELEKKKSYMQF